MSKAATKLETSESLETVLMSSFYLRLDGRAV